MSNKYSPSGPPPSLSNFLPPPTISHGSQLLAFNVSLPPEPHIVYSIYMVAHHSTTLQPLESIEHARSQLVVHNRSLNLLQSTLPSVHIDNGSPILYLFRITSNDRTPESLEAIRDLSFENLIGE